MRSVHRGQLADVHVGVSDDPFAYMYRCAHLATLRCFDRKVHGTALLGPLIPCERRLENMEISEFQEVNSRARFGNRDYDRPFDTFMVTLPGSD